MGLDNPFDDMWTNFTGGEIMEDGDLVAEKLREAAISYLRDETTWDGLRVDNIYNSTTLVRKSGHPTQAKYGRLFAVRVRQHLQQALSHETVGLATAISIEFKLT